MPLTWMQHVVCELFGDSEPPSNWLDSALVSLSPLHDVFALAHGSKLFLCLRGGDIVKSFEKLRTITALACLPVETTAGQSRALWTSFVVGYANGCVEVVDEAGESLIKREFSAPDKEDAIPEPVQSFFLSTSNDKMLVDHLKYARGLLDVLVVYANCVVALSANALHDALDANRARVAEMKAMGATQEELDEVRRSVKCKRYLVRGGQRVKSTAIISQPNLEFDQFYRIAMSANINESHLKSVPKNVLFMTLGEAPLLQANSPFNIEPLKVNELAENVVSTVKSGLMRAATGLFWGSSAKETEQEVKVVDPEQKLAIVYSYGDSPKVGNHCKLSPNKLHLVYMDNQNRLFALDAVSGTLIHIWKGYHHAQIGWIITTDMAQKPGAYYDDPPSLRVACLLAVYLPRRGSLEVWSVERKTRVAEFAVSKRGRLLSPESALLDTRRRSSLVDYRGACFMDENGSLMEIVVPMTSVIDLSSTSHDLLQEQRLAKLLEDSEGGDNESLQESVIELVRGAQTGTGKATLLTALSRSRKVSSKLNAAVLEDCSTKDADDELHNEEDADPVNVFVEYLGKLLRLFTLLDEQSDLVKEKKEPNVEDLLDGLECGNMQATVALEMMTIPPPIEDQEQQFYLGDVLSLFDLPSEYILSTSAAEKKPAPLILNANATNIRAYQRLCLTALKQEQELTDMLKEFGFNASNMLKFLCNCSTAMRPQTVDHLLGQESVLKVSLELFGRDKLQFVGMGREWFNAAKLNGTLYLALLNWTHVLAADEKLNYHLADYIRGKDLCEGYVQVRRKYEALCEAKAAEPKPSENDTLETVFNAGSGRFPELLSQWITVLKVTAKDLEEDEAISVFIAFVSEYFCNSVQPVTLKSHLAWEYFRQWDREKSELELFERGFDLLKALKDDESGVSQLLTALVFHQFLQKVIRECVNYTEIKSTKRVLRDLGLSEKHLPELLTQCVRLTKQLAQNDGTKMEEDITFYDELHITPKTHLLDHIKAMAKEFDVSSDVFALYYQFVLVIGLVWSTRLRNVKPLELFSRTDVNVFFQGESGHTIFTLALNHSLRRVRKQFMSAAVDRTVVTFLHRVTEVGGVDKLEKKVFLEHQGFLLLLAKMWSMPEFQTEQTIYSMFKHGHDSLGMSQLRVYPDRASDLGTELLHLAIVRIAKYMYEHENHTAKFGMLQPHMLDHMTSVQEEAMQLEETELLDTKELLVVVCRFKMDSDAHQTALDYLALTQAYISREEKE